MNIKKLSFTVLLLSTTIQAHMMDYMSSPSGFSSGCKGCHDHKGTPWIRTTPEAALITQTTPLAINPELKTEAAVLKKQNEEHDASQLQPETWLSKENGKNVLKRVKNGTIAATLSYGLFAALKSYAPHLPFAGISTQTCLAMPFLIGAFEDPKDRYSSLKAATLGLTYTVTASLPTKTNMIILGSLIALWAGAGIYEKVKNPAVSTEKEELKN